MRDLSITTKSAARVGGRLGTVAPDRSARLGSVRRADKVTLKIAAQLPDYL